MEYGYGTRLRTRWRHVTMVRVYGTQLWTENTLETCLWNGGVLHVYGMCLLYVCYVSITCLLCLLHVCYVSVGQCVICLCYMSMEQSMSRVCYVCYMSISCVYETVCHVYVTCLLHVYAMAMCLFLRLWNSLSYVCYVCVMYLYIMFNGTV